MDKKYTSSINRRSPRPRSKRLREQGIGGHVSGTAATAPSGNDFGLQDSLLNFRTGVNTLLVPCDSTGNEITWEEAMQIGTDGNIKAKSLKSKVAFWSVQSLAGKGLSGAPSGGGGGGSLFGLYTDTTWVSTPAEDDALSAVLGKSLHARVSVLEGAGYLTGITKAMVEAVLTGDITSHTHSQYIAEKTNAELTQLFVTSGADSKIVLNNTDNDTKYQMISFRQNGAEYGWLGTAGDNNLMWNGYTLLHTGNYASTLDNRYVTLTTAPNITVNNAVTSDKLRINNSAQEDCLQFMQKGSGWNAWDAPSQTYYHVIKLNHGNGDTYYNRTLVFSFFDDRIYAGRMNSGNFKGWKTLAFIDDNVASATKLLTARSIWGQSFDGTAAISGELQHVTALRFDSGNALVEGYGNSWNLWSVNGFQFFPTLSSTVSALSITTNGRVGVNMYSPQYDFDVTGVIHASGEICSDKAIGGKGMTSSSDIRLKHIIGDVELSFEDILNSPSKRFTWLGGADKNERIGTTAQYWLPILPQVVYTSPDGYYAVDYGTLANAKADTIAHVVAKLIEELNEVKRQLKSLPNA